MKIGVLTLHYSHNYGAVIQCYALMYNLKKMGHEVILINRQRDNEINELSILQKCLNVLIPYPFYSFENKYLHPQTIRINTNEGMSELKKYDFDAIIVGSDQVWRKEYTNVGLNYFLDFADDLSLKRISYAASFGKDTWNYDDNWSESVKRFLSSFDAISVREMSAVSICHNQFDVNAIPVLDPTLLLTSLDYCKIFSLKKNKKVGIAYYVLDENNTTKQIAQRISEDNNQQISNLLNSPSKSILGRITKIFHRISVVEWLSLIYNSTFVITDSFHGMVFSIVFRKQFLVIGNINRGLSRFSSLLEILGLTDRLITGENMFDYAILNNKIDYQNVNSILEEEIEKSNSFLIKSLQ